MSDETIIWFITLTLYIIPTMVFLTRCSNQRRCFGLKKIKNQYFVFKPIRKVIRS